MAFHRRPVGRREQQFGHLATMSPMPGIRVCASPVHVRAYPVGITATLKITRGAARHACRRSAECYADATQATTRITPACNSEENGMANIPSILVMRFRFLGRCICIVFSSYHY